MVRKLRYIEQVGRYAGHDLPDFRFVVIRKRKAHEFVEKFHSHIRFHICAHDMSSGLNIIICKHVKHTHKQNRKSRQPYKAQICMRFRRNGGVHQHTDKQGEYKFNSRDHGCTAEIAGEHLFIWFIIRQKPF